MILTLFIFAAFIISIHGLVEDIHQDENYQKEFEAYLSTVPRWVADEALMTVPELIEHHGYPAEVHQVITEDGYNLTLHRIPYGRTGPRGHRKVVYLQHGIISSSADWVITGPGKALAYILADEGYDVWMGNTRGNKYSRQHIRLNPRRSAFWEFSWHEIGIYDVPNIIDYVLEATGEEKLFYIGHSQGTTVFYVMASLLPEYNDKIIAQFSLAPIGFMSHMTSPLLKLVANFQNSLDFILSMFGVNEFLPSRSYLAYVGDVLCRDDSLSQLLCQNALFAICGFNKDQFNASIIPILLGHTPAGSSTDQILHFSQGISSGYFRKFDYGLTRNLLVYSSLRPPSYDLEKITAPVHLVYSLNDWLSHPTDVKLLKGSLPNAQEMILVSDPRFNHVDYMYAIDAKELVYDEIIDLMKKH